jgi:hypothetical protein
VKERDRRGSTSAISNYNYNYKYAAVIEKPVLQNNEIMK